MSGTVSQSRRRQIAPAIQAIAIAMIAAALCVLIYGDRRAGRYSTFNFDRIQDGATLGEVEALLGGTGADLAAELPTGSLNTPVDQPHRFFEWKEPGGDGCIVIALDPEGRVCRKRIIRPSL
jgi:hypothetical protein